MNKLVVKELIQQELTVENLHHELNELLTNAQRREQLKRDYAALRQLLGEGGDASAKAAHSISRFLASHRSTPKKREALDESKAVTHKKTAAIREEISDWTKI